MMNLLRFLGFMAATLAIDIAFGFFGWLIAGERGMGVGTRTTDHLCFAVVAFVFTMHGWRGCLAFLREAVRQP